MKVLFVASACSEGKYAQVCKMRKRAHIDPQQKFCRLLIDGIAECDDVDVEVLSSLPVSGNMIKKKAFAEEIEEISSKLTYRYISFSNGKISRYTSIYNNTKKAVKAWCEKYKDEDKIIICDVLWVYSAHAAVQVGKKYGVKSVGIVTDLPLLSTKMKGAEGNFIKRTAIRTIQLFNNYSLKKYDGYIPLTKSLDEAVNPKSKPSIIVEGSVDYLQPLNNIEKKPVVLYAGGIAEKYGLKNLAEAFDMADTGEYELHVYGAGSYVEELKKMGEKNDKIKYMGCLTPAQVVEKEKEAMLLVNPRPTNEEFSKYSFPSKTLEYMTAGTPLLTTRLSGIPGEYFDHCLAFDDESVAGMAKTLTEALALPDDKLNEIATSAYNFVEENKSNIVQGKRMVDFVRNQVL